MTFGVAQMETEREQEARFAQIENRQQKSTCGMIVCVLLHTTTSAGECRAQIFAQ